jgi:hypothetical protein
MACNVTQVIPMALGGVNCRMFHNFDPGPAGSMYTIKLKTIVYIPSSPRRIQVYNKTQNCYIHSLPIVPVGHG